eukprot:3394742-Amphidinium_carterae.1
MLPADVQHSGNVEMSIWRTSGGNATSNRKMHQVVSTQYINPPQSANAWPACYQQLRCLPVHPILLRHVRASQHRGARLCQIVAKRARTSLREKSKRHSDFQCVAAISLPCATGVRVHSAHAEQASLCVTGQTVPGCSIATSSHLKLRCVLVAAQCAALPLSSGRQAFHEILQLR